MRVKSKVSRGTGKRKRVEVPIAVRDDFLIGESVFIIKELEGKNDRKNNKNRV